MLGSDFVNMEYVFCSDPKKISSILESIKNFKE